MYGERLSHYREFTEARRWISFVRGLEKTTLEEIKAETCERIFRCNLTHIYAVGLNVFLMENFDLSACTIDFVEGLYYPKHNSL